MLTIKHILHKLLFATLFISACAFADSPLTSTEFAQAYQENAIVAQAINSENSQITQEQVEFLADSKNDLGVRLALINALGWQAQNNTIPYLVYIANAYNVQNFEEVESIDELINMMSADQRTIFAYLMAMDEPTENIWPAAMVINAALEADPHSTATNMIAALIQAQINLDDAENWCDVYTAVDEVRQMPDLRPDFKPQAIDLIFEYIDLYKSDCPA